MCSWTCFLVPALTHIIIVVSVTVTPSGQFVSTRGSMAEFACTVSPSAGVMDVQWLVNGSLLDNPTLFDATVQYSSTFGVGRLIFASLSSEFDMTRIGCRAVYSDRSSEDSTESTLLLLQGYLYITNMLRQAILFL